MTKDPKEIDEITGTEVTGHEWDGIKELNTPAPRWWLVVFYVTILWSVGYWFLYPAWPTVSGATKGFLNTNQIKELEQAQVEISNRQESWSKRFSSTDFDGVMKDPDLYNFALSGGSAAFKDNCAVCHGTGATGGKGYPNLNDDDWLWGGRIDDIHQTLLYGIRSGHNQTRTSLMPAFGRDGILTRDEIDQVTDFVMTLSSEKNSSDIRGKDIFEINCASCHGVDGKGGRDFGAPNLTDSIWLYGAARANVFSQINNPKHGVMPYWKGRLDDQTIRQLALYIHSLGGGEKTKPVLTEENSDTGNGAVKK